MRFLRITLALFGIFLFLLGMGLLIRPAWLVERWLWPDAPWISYVFMASVFLSYSFGYFMLAIQGKWRPLRNYSIAGVIGFGGLALYFIKESIVATAAYDQNRLTSWGELILVIAIVNAIYWALSENRPSVQSMRIPLILRWI